MLSLRDLLVRLLPAEGGVLQRFGPLGVLVAILGGGVLLSILAQPPPATYPVGWSKPLALDPVDFGESYTVVPDKQGIMHLAWQKGVDRKEAVFYGRLNDEGEFLNGPLRVSPSGTHTASPSMVLIEGDQPLIFWIERGEDYRALMAAQPGQTPLAITRTTAAMVTASAGRDGQGHIFVVWADNRGRDFDIYLAKLDSDGDILFSDRPLTENPDFDFQPTLAVDGGVLHLLYFLDTINYESLVHRVFDLDGYPLSPELVLERRVQVASGGEEGHPLTAMADQRGHLHLLESLEGRFRYTQIDARGEMVTQPTTFLEGHQHYSQSSLAFEGEDLLAIWPQTKKKGELFQLYAVRFSQGGQLRGAIERLTYSPTSALWPKIVVDSHGGRHLFWQQSTSPYDYSLFYMNDLWAVPIPFWSRLGFSQENGWLSFLLATVAGFMMAIPYIMVNVWRLLIAASLVAVLLWLSQRLNLQAYSFLLILVCLLVVMALLAQPMGALLGQPPLTVVPLARWTFSITASVLACYIAYRWRNEFTDPLAWVGLVVIWFYCFYFLNSVILFRQAFAV